jgi:DNA polymerase-3 subunit delta
MLHLNIMSTLPPVTLLYGDDEFALEEQTKILIESLGSADNILMNVSEFQANNVSFAELQSACDAVPFLSTCRMVLLKGIMNAGRNSNKPASTKDIMESLIGYLPKIPITTALIVIVNRKLPSNSRILKAVRAIKDSKVQELILPTKNDLIQWIKDRAIKLGGSFTDSGAYALAGAGVDGPRALSAEIDKLLAYVNWERAIDADDVIRLVPAAGQADIFLLVDSLAERDAHMAIRELRRLLSNGNREAIGVFGMIVRQYRLLLQTKEIVQAGGNKADVKNLLGLHSFVADKVTRQSQRYRLTTLEHIYMRLLKMDIAMKTGSDNEVILDIMVAGLTA